MIKYNTIEYDICVKQGDIYRYVAKKGYDVELFSDEWLGSDFVKRHYDTIYSVYHSYHAKENLELFYMENENAFVKNDVTVNEDAAYWIGFMYRFMYIESKISSTELLKKIPFDTMCKAYIGMHCIDENDACERLLKLDGGKNEI